MHDTVTNGIEIVFMLVIFIWGAIASWWYRRRMVHDSFKQGSVLLAYYTYTNTPDGMVQHQPLLSSIKEGKLGDEAYYNILSVNGDTLIYTIQLPFQTELHVLAVEQGGIIDEKILESNKTLANVDLEGDFPNYFHLYVTPGQEEQLRYILDPEAMANVIAFCRTNSWELLNDELYVVVTSDSEQLVTLKTIEAFIQQIRPVLASNSTITETPYRMSERQQATILKANCPICKARLVLKNGWHECPNGHGYLLTGAQLSEMRKKQLAIPDEGVPDIDVPHKTISCPACGAEMLAIPYINGHTRIDSCPICQYRWLDGGEEHQIAVQD